MPKTAEQLAESLNELTLHAFDAFCEDITSMFGNAAECAAVIAGQGDVSALKKEFKKLASVNQVESQGTINGAFDLVLDQAGLFILAGVFVMLPEKRVHETIRNGTLQDADYINDAIKEVGNLLIGSWDRIFRENLAGHKHFKQINTFVGPLWNNTQQSLRMAAEQPCRYVICRMKVDEYPEFHCAAVFDELLFHPSPAEAVPPTEESVLEPEKPEIKPATEAANAAEPQTVSEDSPPTASAAAVCITNPVEPTPPADSASMENTGTGPVSDAIRKLTQSPSAAEQPCRTAAAVSSAAISALTVEQMMSQAVLWVDPEETVADVLSQMQQHNAGYVLAGREGQIEGIVSRSDIAAAVSPYTRPVFAPWRRPLDDATFQIRIKWFMSRPVHTIRPEASLTAAMESMMRHSIRALPVTDMHGKTLGLVTVYDIFAALLTAAGISLTGRPREAPFNV